MRGVLPDPIDIPWSRPEVAEAAWLVLEAAWRQASQLGHGHVGTEHLLAALADAPATTAGQALTGAGITGEKIRVRLLALVGPPPRPRSTIPRATPRLRDVLQLAANQASAAGATTVDTDHLLLGLFAEGQGVGMRLFDELGGVEPDVLRQLAGRR